MTTRNCTLETPAGSVRLKVCCDLYQDRLSGSVEYRGTIEALFAVGALTPDMLKQRLSRGRGDPRRMQTRTGHTFRLSMFSYRTGTWAKRTQGAVRLWIAGLDMTRPGMRDLFPKGLPSVVPSPTWQLATTAGTTRTVIH